MCRPGAVIDQSTEGLQRHPIVFVWRPAAGSRAEIDRTNENTIKISLSDAWMRKKSLKEGKGTNLETTMDGMSSKS